MIGRPNARESGRQSTGVRYHDTVPLT